MVVPVPAHLIHPTRAQILLVQVSSTQPGADEAGEALLLLWGEEVAQRQFVAPFERIGVRRGVVEVVGAAQIARAGDGVDEQRVDPCGGRLDRNRAGQARLRGR